MKAQGTCSVLALAFVLALGVSHVAVTAAQPGQSSVRFITGVWIPKPLAPHFERFEKLTGIRVELEDYAHRELLRTIEVRARAQSSDVDVVFVDAPLAPSYATRGLLLPLDDVFSEEEIKKTWPESAVGPGYWQGRLWAPPLNNSSQVLFYNVDLLKKAGIAPPPPDVTQRWTWEQVVEAAKKLTDVSKGIWGFSFHQVNRYYQLQVLPESLGGGPGVSPDGLSVKGYLTNPQWIKAFKFYYDLFNTWRISPKGIPSEGMQDLFLSGKVALFVDFGGLIPKAQEAGINFGVAPHPYFAEGRPVTPTNSWHVGVWKWTKHPEEAKKLVKFLTSDPDLAIDYFVNYGSFPSQWAALRLIERDPRYGEQPFVAFRLMAYEVANTAVVRGRTPAFLEFEEILTDSFEDIRNGTDPKVALSAAEQRIEAAMARYR